MNKDKLLRDLADGYQYVTEAGDASSDMLLASDYYGYARALRALKKSIEEGDYDE